MPSPSPGVTFRVTYDDDVAAGADVLLAVLKRHETTPELGGGDAIATAIEREVARLQSVAGQRGAILLPLLDRDDLTT